MGGAGNTSENTACSQWALEVRIEFNVFKQCLRINANYDKRVIKLISRCVNTACSQLLWQVRNKLLLPCYMVDHSDRLATSCCNKTNTGSSQQVATSLLSLAYTEQGRCHQLVNNLLRTNLILLVETARCKSVGLINHVRRWIQLVLHLSTIWNKKRTSLNLV